MINGYLINRSINEWWVNILGKPFECEKRGYHSIVWIGGSLKTPTPTGVLGLIRVIQTMHPELESYIHT